VTNELQLVSSSSSSSSGGGGGDDDDKTVKSDLEGQMRHTG
jgi:hypothetical protein